MNVMEMINMRQDFNYHTHTKRCGHAIGSDEQYVQAAIDAGFKTIGFSDHGPYKGLSFPSDRMDYSQLEGYLASLSRLRDRYRDRIDVKIGFELEYFDEYLPQMRELAARADYLILGQHTSDMRCDYDFFVFNNDEMALRYCDLLEKGMDTGLFMYVAHPDCYCAGRRDFDATCADIAHRICAHAARLNLPLEINLTRLRRDKAVAYKQGVFYKYPHRLFWQIAARYPVKVVYGYDAHNPADLLDQDSYALCDREIGDLGLTFISQPLI